MSAKKLKDDEDVRTQFVRALNALGIEFIAANTLQAKGRENDFTVRHKNAWFQLAEVQSCLVRPKATVVVEEWPDETLHVRLGKHELVFTVLPARPSPRWERPSVALTTHAPARESRKVSYGRIKNSALSRR